MADLLSHHQYIIWYKIQLQLPKIYPCIKNVCIFTILSVNVRFITDYLFHDPLWYKTDTKGQEIFVSILTITLYICYALNWMEFYVGICTGAGLLFMFIKSKIDLFDYKEMLFSSYSQINLEFRTKRFFYATSNLVGCWRLLVIRSTTNT